MKAPSTSSGAPTTNQGSEAAKADFQALRYELLGAVARITLNRPDVYNSFNGQLSLELIEAIRRAEADNSVRCVLLTGEGKAFSAGQDLAELQGPNPPSVEEILRERLTPLVLSIRNSKLPFVAAVNGVAAGAGANIALCCDIVVASEEASFIQAFVNVGLVPDSAGTFFLPRLLGPSRAAALCMLGEKLSAKEAHSLGLVYQIYTAAAFHEESLKLGRALAEKPPLALALIKQALNESASSTLEEQLDLELRLQKQASESADHKEGVSAFLEKRTPNFTGK